MSLTTDLKLAYHMGYDDALAKRMPDSSKAGVLNFIAEDHAALCEHNAKLRELLDYMTPIAWYAASERERDRMCELGIEVDG